MVILKMNEYNDYDFPCIFAGLRNDLRKDNDYDGYYKKKELSADDFYEANPQLEFKFTGESKVEVISKEIHNNLFNETQDVLKDLKLLNLMMK